MTGNTIYHDWLIISLNQRTDIINKIFCYIGGIFIHPVTWNNFFFICYTVYIINTGLSHIRIV